MDERYLFIFGPLLIISILTVIRKVALFGSERLMRLCVGSITIALAVAITYFGFVNNQIGSNPQTYIGGGIVALLVLHGLSRWFPSLRNLIPKPTPKKCKVCSQPARDVFVIEGNKQEGIYCRRHIIQKFEEAFQSFSFPMVVFHPEQERKYCGTQYPYHALDEMVPTFNFAPESVENIKRIINLIGGKCQSCKEQQAAVAYFAKGVLVWDGSGPVIDKVKTSPSLLCQKCTLKRIAPALTANKEYYVENGLFAPYKQSGVYVNTYL